MTTNISIVVVKILIVVVVLVLFFIFNNQLKWENFENAIEIEKINYFRLKNNNNNNNNNTKPIDKKEVEASNGKKLELLYANYDGKKVDMKEGFIDSLNELPEYQNLFNTPEYINMPNYLEDVYSNKTANVLGSTVSKKLNDIQVSKELSTSLNKTEDEFNAISNLNSEIEQQIKLMNANVYNTNDKIMHNLDKMKLTDMANDYFFIKNLVSK
jgi:hypothetical protein